MLRKAVILVCVAMLVCSGCVHKAPTRSVDSAAMYSNMEVLPPASRGSGGGGSGVAGIVGGVVMASPRYIAVRHKLEIVEAGSGLAKSLEGVVAFCGGLQCEVLASNIIGTEPEATPSGSVSVRVTPQDLNKLLEFVGKQGKIARHATETEDKTSAVVDIEARMKNQTDFRDSLRKMLVKPGVSVADLLQVQEKLAEAQAELDSETTQWKILANETEKVAVEIEFRAEQSGSGRSMFAPIRDALRESGSVLAESFAALITAVAALIPWLIVLVPGGWFLVRAWRRWRRKKREALKAATPAA
jgi:hypothetical protein